MAKFFNDLVKIDNEDELSTLETPFDNKTF